jgi:translation elongation factor EF-Tu-like GTPase
LLSQLFSTSSPRLRVPDTLLLWRPLQSTLVGVLTRGVLDDGRGAARSRVFRHAHEEQTGRTSSIGQHCVCIDSKGVILNTENTLRAGTSEVIDNASKIITLVDLCGHERYLKTTCYGLTAAVPDYACVIVGGNAGLVGMSREHFGIALALRIPAFFVVSKIDMAPEQILKQTVAELSATLRKPGVRRRPFLIKTDDDVVTAARNMAADALTPIFLISAVDGRGLARLRMFLNLLPQREDWGALEDGDAEFLIDEVFSVPGVGTVVAGTLKSGSISDSTRLMLGPDPGDGQFKAAAVKSIHYKGSPVSRVVAGQTAALALKKVKRTSVRKGMVLASPSKNPASTWDFYAEISVLTHSTTISKKYEAVIHLSVLRQTATIELMDRELLRSGDRALVRFRFKSRPEYVVAGTRFVFREGRTKGIGVVIEPPEGGIKRIDSADVIAEAVENHPVEQDGQ